MTMRRRRVKKLGMSDVVVVVAAVKYVRNFLGRLEYPI